MVLNRDGGIGFFSLLCDRLRVVRLIMLLIDFGIYLVMLFIVRVRIVKFDKFFSVGGKVFFNVVFVRFRICRNLRVVN